MAGLDRPHKWASLAPTLAPLGDRPRVALERLAAAGFSRVQLSAAQPGLRPRELDRSARRDLLATLRRLGLGAVGLDLWLPVAHWHDPAQSDRAMDALVVAIRLAGDLGRLPLSVSLASTPDDGADSTPTAIAREAERYGIAIADHAVPPVVHPGLGVGIDPASWLGAGRDPVAAVGAHAASLVSVRLGDLLPGGLRAPLGTGAGGLDLSGYRRALQAASFRGPLVVDVRGWTDPWTGLAQTVQAWRERD